MVGMLALRCDGGGGVGFWAGFIRVKCFVLGASWRFVLTVVVSVVV